MLASPSDLLVCVLGSANSDLFIEVSKIPEVGETLQAKSSFIKNGGKGGNQAVATGRLNVKTYFAGQVGSDTLGTNYLQELKENNVNTDYVRQVNDAPTGQAVIMLNDSGQNSIVIIGGANMAYKDLSTLPTEYMKAIDQADTLLLQMEIPQEINVLAAMYATSSDKLVMLDCGGRDEPIKPELLSRLKFISPNETELARLIGSVDAKQLNIQKIKDDFISKYPQLNIVLKLGEKGSAFISNKVYVLAESVTSLNPDILKDHKIVDTTGAGDVFTASFMVKYYELITSRRISEDKPEYESLVKECLTYGNACAFLCITKKGAMPSNPIQAEVNAFFEKYLPDNIQINRPLLQTSKRATQNMMQMNI
eukprot:TRINITY_DN2755_c0_g1_i11.p1 TRINITY_DN2755_c0_g1~~TRINITY_DN2755_c0_g1_i11.p1  ORF type:complete len:366 (+),score=47.38 TRINITY_DN2755_c0_g1_i11:91-1188(+)